MDPRDLDALSYSCRRQHPQIPWRQMAGMRDVLIHAYDRVDVAEVWTTLSEELPALLMQIEAVLRVGSG